MPVYHIRYYGKVREIEIPLPKYDVPAMLINRYAVILENGGELAGAILELNCYGEIAGAILRHIISNSWTESEAKEINAGIIKYDDAQEKYQDTEISDYIDWGELWDENVVVPPYDTMNTDVIDVVEPLMSYAQDKKEMRDAKMTKSATDLTLRRIAKRKRHIRLLEHETRELTLTIPGTVRVRPDDD